MPVKDLLAKKNLNRCILVLVIGIFIMLPFATPLTVFLGLKLEHLSVFKIWKEIVMVLMAVLILLSGAYKYLGRIEERGLKFLTWLILAYTGWTLLIALLNLIVLDQINWQAFIYAAIINLRFLFFFLLCWLMAHGGGYLRDNWRKLLLIPAAVVVAFGLLQIFILPPNILEHIGYGPSTISAYQTVDQNPDYIRAQSTLRGPNPLGAYLIVIIAAVLVGLRRSWRLQAPLLAGALVVLFYTYSRSALLGLAATLAALIYISITSSDLRRKLAVTGIAVLLLFAGATYAARDNQFVQKTVFHSDETSQSPQSSNEQRAGALKQGLSDVAHEPFGRGPGSAGPASLRNDQPGRIAENYYLQIGQEVGWLGLALFAAINVIAAVLLWKRRQDPLARVLLASFLGLVVVNLVSHGWADDTLSLLWWGMAGVALGSSFQRPNSTDSRALAKSHPDR